MRSRRPFEPLPFAEVPSLPRLPHAFFSPETRTEEVHVHTPALGRVTLSVKRYGAGPKLFLVHGLMTSSYSFRYLFERLGGTYELLVPDLPGAGRTAPLDPDVPLAPEQLADVLAAAMRALGAEGAPVLGNSMGGYLAMWMALRHPEVAGRVLDLHSPGVVTPRMVALDAAFRLPFSPAALDVLVSRNPREWVFRNVHYYDETLKSREEIEEYARPLGTKEGRRAFARYLGDTLSVRGMRAFAAELSRRTFPVPLALVYARRDPMVPPAVGPRLHAMAKGSTLHWLEQGSHFAHVDAPETFLEVARPFLAGR